MVTRNLSAVLTSLARFPAAVDGRPGSPLPRRQEPVTVMDVASRSAGHFSGWHLYLVVVRFSQEANCGQGDDQGEISQVGRLPGRFYF